MENEKITCQICGATCHSVSTHLKQEHPETSIEDYRMQYPDAPVLSERARKRALELKAKREEAAKMAAEADECITAAAGATVTAISASATTKQPMHEIFKLGKKKAAMNSKGQPIPIEVAARGAFADMIPDRDEAYVWNIDLLKSCLMGLEMNIPTYLHGHAGVGKSTVWEQIAACTNRPMIRVQHTANTEEAHVIGQMLANEEGTYFEPGPLTLAMQNGWLYNADEYDYAHPSVVAVYQPVLEGKPLVIKEAPPEWRVIRPHRNFRVVATGNTNGSGDEHALYPGTVIGNAANYSRFGITEYVDYMKPALESLVIQAQSQIAAEDADNIVRFAQAVRTAFSNREIGATVGPRELIFAARIGLRRSSWTVGLKQAFINRLNEVDREVVGGIAQRIFG